MGLFAGESEGGEAAAKRGHPRDSLFLQATIGRAGAARAPLRVRNLSTGGLMADCAGAFGPGDRVEVELRGIGLVPGQVAWRTEHRIGVAFDSPIDPKAARKPVGTIGSGTGWQRPSHSSRRPGLRID